MVSAEPADSGRSKQVVPVEQQVLVALRGGGGGGESESSAEVMEVSVFGLQNNSVTLICEETRPQSGASTTARASSSLEKSQ